MLITKEFTFDSAHLLSDYDGKCNNLHGHTYKLKVYIKGIPNKKNDSNEGMILDFGEIKEIIMNHIIEKYDHSLITTKKESFYGNLNKNIKYCVLEYPFNIKTTCEMIGLQIISELISLNIGVEAIELWETPTSSCYITVSDLEEYISINV